MTFRGIHKVGFSLSFKLIDLWHDILQLLGLQKCQICKRTLGTIEGKATLRITMNGKSLTSVTCRDCWDNGAKEALIPKLYKSL
jgi:hypothetical protein